MITDTGQNGRWLRQLLTILATLVSLSVFCALLLQAYFQTADDEQRYTDAFARQLAVSLAELAYDDPQLWEFQEERMAAIVAAQVIDYTAAEQDWSIVVTNEEGAVLFERLAEDGYLSLNSRASIGVGYEIIGRVRVAQQLYDLTSRLSRALLFAILPSLAVFAILFWIPLKALRRRERQLADALELARSREEEALASRERLTAAAGGMRDGLALFGSDAKLIMCNASLRKIARDWGLSPQVDTAIGPLLTHLAPEGEPVLAKNQIEANSSEQETPTGRWISWTLDESRSGDRLLVIRDVTAEREARDRLAHAHHLQALGQLSAGIAHDFNNMLAIIQGNAELLDETDPELSAIAQPIVRACRNGASLTQRLLAFARQQPLAARPTDLAASIRRWQRLLRTSLGAEIEVKVETAEDLWHARIDPSQLENALLNLAVNARDALPNGGVLTIACRNLTLCESRPRPATAGGLELPAGDYVVLSVCDNGTGMSEAHRARAFEPFFTTKPFGLGSGMGLSMVLGFAEQSGGTAKLESAVGRGTCVTLYLPR